MGETKEYFAKKAEGYDLVENQPYWQLSDKLLWDIFKEKILSKLPENFSFLDAGGGTGRWTNKILKEFPEATGVIYDLSEAMLAEAKKKFVDFGDKIKVINGNLENMESVGSETFDLVFNFHNVLGFVDNTKKAISEMTRILKKKGFLVSFVPSLYHLVYFNIKNRKISLAEEAIKKEKSKFVEEMPEIELFTPEKIKALYSAAGISNSKVLGFPITIYPGYNETQIEGSSQELLDILSDKSLFSRIYEIEKKLISEENSSRGNNLFVWGQK